MKHLLTIFTLVALSQQVFAQYANQDCVGAVPLCNSRYELPYSFSGNGNTEEILDRPGTCFITGENNSAWYKLAFQSAGQLVFSITPYSLNDDYDFALYDATGRSCADISTGSAPELRCNYAVTTGVATGIDTGGTGTSGGPNGPDFLIPLQVDSGDVLYLLIDNFTRNGQGFAIDFAGTTADMISNDSFYITSGYTTVMPDTIKVDMFFNQTFYCSTLSSDFSEFTFIDDVGDTLEIVSLQCDSAMAHVRINALHPAHQVALVNVFYNDGFDGNIIIAQCGGAELDGTPKTFEARNGIGKLDFTYTQVADSFTFFALAHPTASVRWFINDTLWGAGRNLAANLEMYKPYKVCLVADYTDIKDSVCKYYYITGLYVVDALQAFQLYPNPSNTTVTIALPFGAEWIEVVDLSGKLVSRFESTEPATTLNLSTASLPQGLYLVRVAYQHGIAVQKLHVAH
ncbi:hypothetical protein BH09BAC1_BH09BAC1_20040 [soil metagenome]